MSMAYGASQANVPTKYDSNDELLASVIKEVYRPRSCDEIVANTFFTRSEVKSIYRGFKQDCPSGIIDKDTFKDIFCSFFPQGDASTYADIVFNACAHDIDNSQYFNLNPNCVFEEENSDLSLTFEQYIAILSNLCRGRVIDKLEWIYKLYDDDNKGYLTYENFLNVANAIYDAIGTSTEPNYDEYDVENHARNAFDRIDWNRDGVVTKEEFMNTASTSQTILDSLAVFETLSYMRFFR